MFPFIATLGALAVLSWVTFPALFFLCRKKHIRMTHQQRWYLMAVMITLFGVLAYCAVFEDQDFIFDCRRETHQCEYWHSTFTDKKLRLAKTYDISKATGVNVSEHYHRRRSGYRDYYYKVAINTPEGGFEMPYEFSVADFAREEASKFAAFFAGQKPSYRYEKFRSGNANELFTILGFMFSFLTGLTGCLVCGSNLYKESKENKQKQTIYRGKR